MRSLKTIAAAVLALPLACCVTTAPSPVDDAFTSSLAPPAVTVVFADPDGLPRAYDAAMRAYAEADDAALDGTAVRWVEAELAFGIEARLTDAYVGTRPARLLVRVENVILPDRTRFTPLSGQKSFLVTATLTTPDGTVLAETPRGFTVLSDMQRTRLGGSAWSRLGRTDQLRAEAIVTLTEATAEVVGDALTGGRTQTGMSGKLTAYPDRIAP